LGAHIISRFVIGLIGRPSASVYCAGANGAKLPRFCRFAQMQSGTRQRCRQGQVRDSGKIAAYTRLKGDWQVFFLERIAAELSNWHITC